MLGTIILIYLAFVCNVQGYPDNITKVVGGQKAKNGSFPWQISMQYGFEQVHFHVCGGSVLNSRWILTAAHCFFVVAQIPKAQYFVLAGVHSLKEQGQFVKVNKSILHPKYKGKIGPNDIALLKLDGKLVLNDRVQAIQLPKSGTIPTGQSTLSGWGSTSTTTTPNMPDKLLSIDLPLITYKECANALKKLSHTSQPLRKTNICTGPINKGGKGACTGDSGGPLIQRNGAREILIGVVSWGLTPCGSRGAPSIYTRVSAFKNWIEKNIKRNLK